MKVISFKIEVMDDKYDFNWAHLTISEPSAEGADFSLKIDFKVPKTINDLDEIKTYVLDRTRRIDLKQI